MNYQGGKIGTTKKSAGALLATASGVALSDRTAKMRRNVTPKSQFEYVRLLNDLMNRSECRCWYCGVRVCQGSGDPDSAEIDHVHPLSLGGLDEVANLALSCRSCNRRKRDFSLEIFRRRRGGGLFWFEEEGLKP